MATHDLILYGATGFTGRLVADHLDAHAGDDVSWAIAGRRKEALQAVAADLGRPDLPIVVADATDPDSLAAMAESTNAVCSTVGPYARYGGPLVEACARAGTDYCDLTGEVHWMREMIDAHHDTAVRSGARIVHACGFDSIPSDIGALFAQRQMRLRHGVAAKRVSGRLKGASGGISGGTLASGLDLLDATATDAAVAKVVADDYALNPAGTWGPEVSSHVIPHWDADFGAFVAPFVMEQTNARVVRRSAALLAEEWGTDFAYDEGLLTGSGPLGAVIAGAVAGGMATAMVTSRFGPVRGLLRRLAPEPGTGPSPEAQRKGYWDFRLFAEHPSDGSKSVTVRLRGDADPGYGSTSKMLGESALALASGESDVDGGFWTPATAIGDALLRRLPANAGVTLDVLQ